MNHAVKYSVLAIQLHIEPCKFYVNYITLTICGYIKL